MYLTILRHATKATCRPVGPTVCAIHRRPLNVQRLCAPLLVGVGGLGWRQVRHLQIAVVRRLLAAPAKVGTSVGEDLLVGEDVVEGVAHLTLAHVLEGARRRRH